MKSLLSLVQIICIVHNIVQKCYTETKLSKGDVENVGRKSRCSDRILINPGSKIRNPGVAKLVNEKILDVFE